MARKPTGPKPKRRTLRRGKGNEEVPLLKLPDAPHPVVGKTSDIHLDLQPPIDETAGRLVPAKAKSGMKLLVGVVMYENPRELHGIKLPSCSREWLKAWDNAIWPPNCTLAIVQNYNEFKEQEILRNIIGETVRTFIAPPIKLIPRNNRGRDIGALQDLIKGEFTTGNYSHLFWCTDDCLPMRPDFLDRFIEEFAKLETAGLVGNYWVPNNYYANVPAHIRTVAFMLRRQAALGLKFPEKLDTKEDCYEFEYGKFNMTQQVLDMGFKYGLVRQDSDIYEQPRPWYACNDVMWDCGEIHKGVHWDWRRRQDHWARYEEQFRR